MQRTCLLFLTLFACLNALAQPTPTAYHVVGRCNDYYTALGLKATIYALVNGERQKLGECNDVGKFEPMTGTFKVLVPAQASHLILAMTGYRPVSFPIHFADSLRSDEPFAIYNLGDMTPIDSLPKPVDVHSGHGQLIVCHFVLPDTLRPGWLSYNLTNLATGKRTSVSTTARGQKGLLRIPVAAEPGECMATLTDKAGHLLSIEMVVVKPGVTFKTVRVQKIAVISVSGNVPSSQQRTQSSADTVAQQAASLANVPAPAITAPSTTTLYFDQSSHELRTQTLPTLDSLADVLMSRPLQATVTGYTDNVGQRSPNVILSEYRARRVATYLKQRGVSADQLTTRWKGPDSTAKAATDEAEKVKSRRVEIQVAPR